MCSPKMLSPSFHLEVLCRSASSASAASQPCVELVGAPYYIDRVRPLDPMRREDYELRSSDEEDELFGFRFAEDSVTAGVEDALFAVCSPDQRVHSSEEVFNKIQKMRSPEYMRTEGFLWADGIGKRSQGRKVQSRFRESASYVVGVAKQPTLEELMQYVKKRFPELAGQITEEPFQIDAANRSPQQGRWYKMMRRLAPCRGISGQVVWLGGLG